MMPGPDGPEPLRRQLLSFWVGFVLLTLGLWLVVTQQVVLRPVCELTADLLAASLQAIGQDVQVIGNVVSGIRGGVAFEIIGECTAMLPMSFVAALMLNFPVSWRSRLLGLACAVPVVWPCLMVLFPLVLVLCWGRPSIRDERHEARVT